MYTHFCILKLVTRVHTYKQNLGECVSRYVHLYTHPSVLKKILNFVTSPQEIGSRTRKLHAYKTLKEARSLLFTAALASKAKRAPSQIESTVSLTN